MNGHDISIVNESVLAIRPKGPSRDEACERVLNARPGMTFNKRLWQVVGAHSPPAAAATAAAS